MRARTLRCGNRPRPLGPESCKRPFAFTLVELLVVIGIIGLLIGIIMPSLAKARRAAQSAACLGQLRQIAVATSMYVQDSRGFFPRSSHSALAVRVMPWGYALCPYLGRKPYEGPGDEWDELFRTLYRCPADDREGKWSYGKSVWFELTGGEIGELFGLADAPTYHKITSVRRASATVLFAELESGSMGDHIMAHYWYIGGAPEVDVRRHGRASNFAFVDGHCETLPFDSTFDLPRNIDQWNPARAR